MRGNYGFPLRIIPKRLIDWLMQCEVLGYYTDADAGALEDRWVCLDCAHTLESFDKDSTFEMDTDMFPDGVTCDECFDTYLPRFYTLKCLLGLAGAV